MKGNTYRYIAFGFCAFTLAFIFIPNDYPKFETPWGEEKFDRYSYALIKAPVIERLKYVDQSGPAYHFCHHIIPAFSRYDHSIGVWALLKKFKCSLKEQIGGLFHDVSHTVFSHVAPHIFAPKEEGEIEYQDIIHMRFIKSKNLAPLLKKFGLKENDLDIDNAEYKGLEQSLPDICADRLQYNIHTGVILNLISKQDAKEIIDNIRFENGIWFFTSEKIAKKFADISLYCTQNFWGALWNIRANKHLAQAITRAIEIENLTEDDLFSTDIAVLKKLKSSDDEYIKLCLQHCDDPLLEIKEKSYEIQKFKPKFRGIDPLIKNEKTGEFCRLLSLNLMFGNAFNELKKWCETGYEVKLLVNDFT